MVRKSHDRQKLANVVKYTPYQLLDVEREMNIPI